MQSLPDMDRSPSGWFKMDSMGKRSFASLRRALAVGLKARRQARQLSQAGLASQAGVRQALVSEIELAEANPTIESLHKIASALGVGIEDLLAD